MKHNSHIIIVFCELDTLNVTSAAVAVLRWGQGAQAPLNLAQAPLNFFRVI